VPLPVWVWIGSGLVASSGFGSERNSHFPSAVLPASSSFFSVPVNGFSFDPFPFSAGGTERRRRRLLFFLFLKLNVLFGRDFSPKNGTQVKKNSFKLT
jgi:hypothetical protein